MASPLNGAVDGVSVRVPAAFLGRRGGKVDAASTFILAAKAAEFEAR
ncbi:MAG TPA: hypothetical protein VGI35_08790 [Steroidobacteraceae bacterium]